MERKLVTIEKILELNPIEGADVIESALVRGWNVVVKKGEFKVGDKVLYFEIDSFLPVRPEYEFLLKGGKPKKMIVGGKEVEGIRLRTIKLRGSVSQGLVMPCRLKGDVGEDVSDKLGVIKWEQPTTEELNPRAVRPPSGFFRKWFWIIKRWLGIKPKPTTGPFPSFLRKTDEERIQNCGWILEKYKDVMFVPTEKLDGCSATYYKYNGKFGVCSRNNELFTKDNIWWRMAEKYEIKERIPDGVCLQGEIIGPSIQKNPLKRSENELFLFNSYDIKNGAYMNLSNMWQSSAKFFLSAVPHLPPRKLNYTLAEILKEADGPSLLNPDCPREGLVFRPEKEMIDSRFGRVSFKAISNSYLLNEKE